MLTDYPYLIEFRTGDSEMWGSPWIFRKRQIDGRIGES